jgi:hypothetical protein
MAPAGGGGCGILVARRSTRRRKCAMRSASRCRASLSGWQFVADWSKHGFDLLRGDSALPRVLARRRPALIDVIDSAAAIFDNLVNVSIGCPVHATCAGGWLTRGCARSRFRDRARQAALAGDTGSRHWLATLSRAHWTEYCVKYSSRAQFHSSAEVVARKGFAAALNAARDPRAPILRSVIQLAQSTARAGAIAWLWFNGSERTRLNIVLNIPPALR